MADWYYRHRTTIHHEWVIPIREGQKGACWNQVQQAIDAAAKRWNDIHRIGRIPDRIPPDDAIRIIPLDNSIVVWFEEEPSDKDVF